MGDGKIILTLTEITLLLLAANGAPILAYDWLRERGAWAVDGGRQFVDGGPLFGPAKTWRGIAAAIAACAILAPLLGWSAALGAQFGLYVMLGDLFSSFIKRRLHIAAMGRATGLDQIPEALLPLWLLREELALGPAEIILLVAVFFFVEMGLSVLLYRLHIRQRPY